MESEHEERLPKDRLYALCKLETVQKFVRRSDYAFYQALVDVLIPDVLRPIPSSLTQAIRNFAKSLENWLKGSMTGVPEEMIKTKVTGYILYSFELLVHSGASSKYIWLFAAVLLLLPLVKIITVFHLSL